LVRCLQIELTTYEIKALFDEKKIANVFRRYSQRQMIAGTLIHDIQPTKADSFVENALM